MRSIVEMALLFQFPFDSLVGKPLKSSQQFSLGIHRNVGRQMVAPCPGSLITKCTNQTSLQIMVCVLYFVGIMVCVLLVVFFLSVLSVPNATLKWLLAKSSLT